MNFTQSKLVNRIKAIPQFIKEEPMLYSCDYENATKLGGFITSEFVNALKDLGEDIENYIFDSRTQMLMPNMYPAIPGWHCDDVPRDNGTGQPNFNSLQKGSKIFTLVADLGTDSFTEFLLDPVSIPDEIIKTTNTYKHISEYIENQSVLIERAPNWGVVEFDEMTLHRATSAKTRGWRFWIRATKRLNRKSFPMNEIRTSANVYVVSEHSGW